MNVLVTGATGMLGRSLCTSLKKSHKVVGISRSGAEGSLACELSDAPSLRRVLEVHPIDIAVNTAAFSDVDGCERDPKLAYDSNTLAAKNLSEAFGAKKIPWVHVSTDYVFDGRKRDLYKENDPTGPVNIYGLTKWIAEFYAMNSASPCAVVRTSWLFGGPNPKNFVNALAARLAKENTVSVLDDQMDAPTSVKDLSAAIERIMATVQKISKGSRWNEVFHVCNQGGTTRLEMTRAMRDAMGRKDVKVERTDPASIQNRVAIRPAYVVMSPEKFEKNFGLKMRPWQESLKEYIQACEF